MSDWNAPSITSIPASYHARTVPYLSPGLTIASVYWAPLHLLIIGAPTVSQQRLSTLSSPRVIALSNTQLERLVLCAPKNIG